MKKTYFSFIFACLYVLNFSVAQCPIGSVNLNSQTAVNDFIAQYPNCHLIDGNLSISGNVTDLSGLTMIDSVAGNLTISNASTLTSLNGLDSIAGINGNLYIYSLNSLTNLSGLNGAAIQQLTGYLYLWGNATLQNIDALNGLTAIGSYVRFSNNAQLNSLAGLAQLNTIGSYLLIDNNNSLPNLTGIAQIQQIGTYLEVRNNDMLTDCSATCNLLNNDVIGTTVSIYNNPSTCSSTNEVQLLCPPSPCPIGDISLESQHEVVAFIQSYNGCSTINGNLTIRGNGVTDLSGLNFLTTITGNLTIRDNTGLTTLNGLQNISTIGGDLYLINVETITDLTGLNGAAIQEIGGYLNINNNNELVNLDALLGIQTIGNYLSIQQNLKLTSITGLGQVEAINSYLTIYNNAILPNVNGLAQIQEIEGSLNVYNNAALSDCSALCTVINNNIVEGSFYIYNNPSECSSVNEVWLLCPTTPCPIGDFDLTSQLEVDAFIQSYGACNTVTGNLTIRGNSVTDLSGLNFLTTITGSLTIRDNTGLTTLNGLQNISTIGGDLYLRNVETITDLTGLNGAAIQEIGGYLNINNNNELVNLDALLGIQSIGNYLSIQQNPKLTSITGLGQLKSINSYLTIYNNAILPNVNGLAQIQEIEGALNVYNNAALSDCSALCTVINNNVVEGSLSIYNNPSECSSVNEVRLLCPTTPCPIGDFDLTSQLEVDAFIQSYGACNTVTGNLTIRGNSVTDLSGLNFLTTITGSLTIRDNTGLTTLNGLQNISTIGGDLYLRNVETITDLTGLNGAAIQEIGGYLNINNNNELVNLDALLGIQSIGNYLSIQQNLKLTSITGLGQLEAINSYLNIYNNAILPNVNGLAQIQEIEGALNVYNNAALVDCSALCAVINNNVVEGSFYIYNNPSECSSVNEVQLLCPPTPCPIGSFDLTSQLEVDAFIQSYGACNTVTGNLTIRGNSVTDISGLDFLTTITGNLTIRDNTGLTTLNGLQNISTIGGDLYLRNVETITDLTGLNGAAIQEIGGYLNINNNNELVNLDALLGIQAVGNYLSIQQNPKLISITGLGQLRTVEAALTITTNNMLPSLAGFEQLVTIGSTVTIGSNSALTDCSSLCPIFNANTIGGVSVYSNPADCNTRAAIEASCTPSSCTIGNVTLSDQTALSTFVSTHNSCDSLFGNLTITGTVSDLSGLSFLKYLSGNLTIVSNSSLMTLIGFNQLEVNHLQINNCSGLNDLTGLNQIDINRDLMINSCANLTSLIGLEHLDTVGGNFSITNNANLINVAQLGMLQVVKGNLAIQNNDKLPNLTGLTQVATIRGNLSITSHSILSDCSALCNAVNNGGVGGTITINGNPAPCSSANEFIYTCVNSGCPTGDITLNTQGEVTAFVNAYSSCDSIKGNLTINGYSSITDLSGLSFLTYIGGYLRIYNNYQLDSLNGLQNITHIGGYINIDYNTNLEDISALSQIDTITEYVRIYNNDKLLNLSGLNQLKFVDDYVEISNNNLLNSIAELSQLDQLEGRLTINNNDALTNLNGLQGLTTIGGGLTISGNAQLSDCSVLCNLLNNAAISGSISISSNPAECSSLNELSLVCTPTSCPVGNITLNTQAEVDVFVNQFAACDSIKGNLTINGNSSITDLSGLSFLTYVGGYLRIYNNYQLDSLNGLQNITKIGGYINIETNTNLEDISALSQIDTIAEYVRIYNNDKLLNLSGLNQLKFVDDYVEISNNNGLNSIAELSQLDQLEGRLTINNNDALTNLNGLQGLTAIGGGLTISGNALLSDCSVLCNVLNNVAISGSISISNNPTQCSSINELNLVCTPTSCPVGNVTLNTQAEVDVFASQFAACDSIKGNLTINGYSSITDLSGLSFLTYVEGDLYIHNNYQLDSLNGLQNITSIGGYINIDYNTNLEDISALSQIDTIREYVRIYNNDKLLNLSGLNQLKFVDDYVEISNNNGLNSIAELSQLDQLEGRLTINNNDALTNLNGLQGLTAIGGGLTISGNAQLNDCSVLCNVLNNAAISGSISISNNPTECSSINELSLVCTPTSCPVGNITLNTQAEVDVFVNQFAACDSIKGNLTINGYSSITDLSGLSFLTYIGGYLRIDHNYQLDSLNGLQNITKIGGYINIETNTNLEDISALSQIDTIREYVRIYNNDKLLNLSGLAQLEFVDDNLEISSNNLLNSIAALGQLQEVEGSLILNDNDALTSLNGLQNLDIIGGNLQISGSATLSDCNTVCRLINNNGVSGSISIYSNPSMCSSLTELTTVCADTDCPEGDVILSTQTEVNSFVTAFAACDSMPYSLTIQGGSNITDISGLSFLTYIGGNLNIQNNYALTNLVGLSNISNIGGNLRLSNNNKLETISDLNGIQTINNDLIINRNDSLNNLTGLTQIMTVGGQMNVTYNYALTDCSALCDLVNNDRVSGPTYIYGNPSACSSLTEVTTLCSGAACPEGDIVLTTQIEVNAFVTAFATCDSLPGSLEIRGGNNITDISGLSFIKYIAGNLVIQSSYGFQELAGFEQLVEVVGDLRINYNRNLVSIDSLHQLVSIGGGLFINGNDSLRQLNGLQQVDTLGSNLQIRNNYKLGDCSGICDLINHSAIGGTVSIYGNPSACSSITEVTTLCSEADCPEGDVVLQTQNEVNAFVTAFATCDSLLGNLQISGGNNITDLSGLSFITYIAGDLIITNNYTLNDLDGLQNLQEIGGDIQLQNNRDLTSLSQFQQLTSITGQLRINNNDSLVNLTGLDQLTTIGNNLTIQGNFRLSDCSAICTLLDDGMIGGNINITNNPSECSTSNEVQSLCTYGSQISTLALHNLADTLEEGDSIKFNITVDFAPADTLWVTLSTTNAVEVMLPNLVPIPPGKTTVLVAEALPNDTLPEATEAISITVGAPYLTADSDEFTLTDNDDIPAISLEILQDTISESAGIYATTITVHRLSNPSGVLNVALSANVNNALIMPNGLAMANGEIEKTIYVGALDNAIVDGFRTIDLTAKVIIPTCGCTAESGSLGIATQAITIADNDGPTINLFVDPLSLQEGVVNAGNLTVQRNTATGTALTVNLTVSDETELSLPATVTIPAGALSVNVPITTLSDPITDGNQQVSIQANADGFSPGIVWAIVTDVNKPDLQIAQVSLPTVNIPSSDVFQFRVFIKNAGFATAPSGIVLKGYLSDNNTIDANDFLIGEYQTDVAIPVGDTVEIVNLGNTPYQPKGYQLLFEVNPDQDITELLYLNNTSTPLTVGVLPDYLGMAEVADAIFVQNEKITISGKSHKADGTIVPNADLEVYIITNQVRRTIQVTTDEMGQYMTEFDPMPGEAGHYTIGASFPGQGSETTQDAFDILGVIVNNNANVIWNLLVNDTLSSQLSLRNRSMVDLPNLTIVPLSLPDGCSLTFDTIPSFTGGTTLNIAYEISGAEVNTNQEYLQIPLAVVSENDTLQTFTGYYFIQAQKSYLRSEVSRIDTKISADKSRTFEFKIFNDGMGESEAIGVNIPEASWMQLRSQKILPSMSSGDTSIVILEFIPSAELPLNTPATGTIRIIPTNGNTLSIPYTLEKVSNQKGGVVVDVIDNYTYFTEEAPHVANASVKISHYFTGEVFAEGVTDADGLFMVDSLPEGNLRLVVQADKHQGYDGLIYVSPGDVTTEVVFLKYQSISFSWDVVPTTIEDEYEIDLIMTFETNVPSPVVLIEMPETLPALVGDETFSFNVTLTNKGLITAQEVGLIFPDDPEYEFMTNYIPVDMLAQQAIQVPVTMKRKDSSSLDAATSERGSYHSISNRLNINAPAMVANGRMDENCSDIVIAPFWYKCGENGVYERTASLFEWEFRVCSGEPSETTTSIDIVVPPPGPGISGPSGDDGNCIDCGGPPGDFPEWNIDCKCNDCLKNMFLAATNCARGPVGVIGGAAFCLVRGCNPFNPPNCVDGLLQAAETCGCSFCGCIADVLDVDLKKIKKLNLKNVINSTTVDQKSLKDKLVDAINNVLDGADGGIIAAARNNAAVFPTVLIRPMDDVGIASFKQRLQDYGAILYFGDLVLNDNFLDFVDLVAPFVRDTLMIDQDQQNYVIAEMAAFDIELTEMTTFFTNWNSTVEAWGMGIYEPTAQYPNIINKLELDALEENMALIQDYVEVRGFETMDEMVDHSIEEVRRLTKTSSDPDEETAFNPVCASVSINISQKLTMTREAFEGTLSVYNGHPTDALQNLSLNLEILDENGVNSNDLFEIETKELGTLTGIDGMGTLNAETEGFAKILFIPEKGAAPTVPKNYSFGGSISYLDPFSGLIVTMPLIPATLQVNPSPDLFLHYFMQRNIYGDDPLTPPIEPIIPADLAVMIENNGYGVAQNVFIESAQPEVIENDKGLAIHFSLIGSKLQGAEKNLGLNTIGFGNIEPFKTKIGQWYFTSNLLGHFTNYETNLVHLDSRGNPDLSLVSGATLHELIHTVRVYTVEDGIDDFLVNEIPDLEGIPDAIYLSQGNQVFDVYPAENSNSSGNILAAGNTTTLTVDPFALGWNYTKLDDPGNGNFTIVSITRNSDNQSIPLSNAWLTHVTIQDTQAPDYENKFHFVDNFEGLEPVSYTVVWSPKDPNPPEVISITGHPASVTAQQVTTLTVTFSEPIIDSTFTAEDVMLSLQGGSNIVDGSVNITKTDSVTYAIDISGLTTSDGAYVFTAQAAGVKDFTGTNGLTGKQVAWTQFLDVPSVLTFQNLPENGIDTSFDTIPVFFNMELDPNTVMANRFFLTKGGAIQSGTLGLRPLDMDNRLFEVSAIDQVMTTDGAYQFCVDLVNIQSANQTNGLDTQCIDLVLDKTAPTLVNMVRFRTGGLDDQHYTGVQLNFSEDISELDSFSFELTKGMVTQNIMPLDLKIVDEDWYEIRWLKSLTYEEGNYAISLDMGGVKDKAGNIGSGIVTQNWTVDRTAELAITNLQISPDMGISNTDGITATRDLTVQFSINESARAIRVYQNDNGTLRELATQSSATAGTLNFPVTFNTGGQTEVVIKMEDLMGNAVEATKTLYIDESALTAEWDFAEAQQLVTHPSQLLLNFGDTLLGTIANPNTVLSFSYNNTLIEPANWTFAKTSDKTYLLSDLTDLGSEPGLYKVGVDLNQFNKQYSGQTGNAIIYACWELIDTNKAPIAIAGKDTVIKEAMIVMLDGMASYDPNGDELTYKWYPPTNVQLNSDTLPNPTFSITTNDQGANYSFLLSVNDGKETNTDVIRVAVELIPDSINILSIPMDTTYCANDSLRIDWEVFGPVKRVNMHLSSDNGTTFPLVVANEVDTSEAPIKYPLSSLSGSQFVLQISDTTTNGFIALSDTFTIRRTDTTDLEILTCNPDDVGIMYETYTNDFGCDSIVKMTFILDTAPPIIRCLSTYTVNLAADKTATISPNQVNDGTMDLCNGFTLSLSKTTFSCADLGTQTITLTAIDDAMNQSTCNIEVTVTDNNGFCTDCQPGNLVINDNPMVSGDYFYQDSIIAAGKINLDTNVTFKAGKTIILQPGFEVERGGVFTASIENCTPNFTIVEVQIAQKNKPDLPKFKLGQNRPNPFTESTLIDYVLPVGTAQATIRIVSHFGQLMEVKSLPTNIEKGQLEIQGKRFSAGIYFYSLIVDGELLETRRMVLTR